MLTSLLTFCNSHKFICKDLEQRSILSIGYISVFHFRTFFYKGFKTQFLSLYSDKNLGFKALTFSILVNYFRSIVLTSFRWLSARCRIVGGEVWLKLKTPLS